MLKIVKYGVIHVSEELELSGLSSSEAVSTGITSISSSSVDLRGRNSTKTLSSDFSGFVIAIDAYLDNRFAFVFSDLGILLMF